MKESLIKYSLQIAMLKQVSSLSLITEDEYDLMKSKLMQDYHIITDFAS